MNYFEIFIHNHSFLQKCFLLLLELVEIDKQLKQCAKTSASSKKVDELQKFSLPKKPRFVAKTKSSVRIGKTNFECR